MNKSPVLLLQEMASSTSVDIEALLMKAKMIAVKLGQQDIYNWLEYELNAYPSYDSLPDYRVLKDVPLRAWNPYKGWIPVEISNLQNTANDIYKEIASIHMINPISMLVEFAKSKTTLYMDLPPHSTTFIRGMTNTDFRISYAVNPNLITKILTNTKSRVLDWALMLESKKILGEGLLFSSAEIKEAAHMSITNINNFHGDVTNSGAISAGQTGDITQTNSIIPGDFESLKKKLNEYGVEDSDIAELKKAIDSSPTPVSSDNLGPNIGGWVGNMIGKAYSGALQFSAKAAPVVLANAICHYFNIPV